MLITLELTKSFAWVVSPVVGLFTPREKRGVNKPNDFVNAKSHARKNPWSQGKWQLDIYKGAK